MSARIDDAELAAFLAGAIGDEARLSAIEAALNADPALAERAEALANDDPASEAVRAAFAPVLAAAVPDHLVRMVAPSASAQVVRFPHRPAMPDPGPAPMPVPMPANDTGSTWRWPQFAAMAASLAVGVMVGGAVLSGSGAGSTPTNGSLVLASADLGTMLDTAASGQPVKLDELGTGEVVLTFRNADGQLCRQFTLEAGAGTSDALACAQGDKAGWQIEAYGRRPAPAGEIKLASGDAAPAVVAAVDAMIDSDPLVGADELAELKAK